MAEAPKLRILFIARQYPPDKAWGGIGSYVAIMSAALAARGHDVHVLSCVEGQECKDSIDQGVHIHYRQGIIPSRLYWRLKRILQPLLRIPKTLWRFEKGLGTFLEYRRLGVAFDVIEYADWGGMGCVFALLHPRPIVAHLHTPPAPVYETYGGVPMDRDLRRAASLVYFSASRSDVFTCASRQLVDTVQHYGWLRGHRADIVPLPIDWHEWSRIPSVHGTDPTVLFVGSLEQLKAPEILVKAMAVVRKSIPRARAIFVGTDRYMRDGLPYVEWIQKSGYDLNGCEFTGVISMERLYELYSASRVVAVPSWFEVYNVVTLEAMAAGRPVVTTAANGVASFIEKFQTGRVVPAGDASALSDALLPFLSDEQCAASVGEKGRLAVREWHDPARVAACREDVYRKAIDIFQRKRNRCGRFSEWAEREDLA